MHSAHKIRLDPTDKQIEYFCCACGVARYTYNWALEEWNRQYAAGEKPNGRQLKKKFNSTRKEEFPWTYDVARDATSQPFDNIQSAFIGFFKGISGYPQFKKKGVHDSFYVRNDRLHVEGKRIRLPRIGWIRMREALRFEGKIMSATVSRTADKWFVSINVQLPDKSATCENQAVVGVDLGIKTLATLSTGEQFEAPKPLAAQLEKLRRLSRRLSRKQKGSKNREKARLKLARLYYKISCTRLDVLHKLTTLLVQRYGTIVIEDLNVKGMVRNRHLARAISDLGFYEFRRQLTYKAVPAGARIVVADRWYPSSKLCSDCGFKLDVLPLSVREWDCPVCGVVHDRDTNAAQNLEKLGWATPEVTPVEMKALAFGTVPGVKLSSVKQELCSERVCSQER